MAGFGHIDVHTVTAPKPATKPVPQYSPDLSMRSKLVIIVAVVAVITLISAAVSLRGALTPGPADVVEDYFAYIQDDEVDNALALMNDIPTGESGRFLDARALDNDSWEVKAIEPDDKTEEQRTVDVTIEGPDEEVTITVELIHTEENGWLIDNNLRSIHFDSAALSYIQVNDVVIGDHPARPYYLLPGVYEFYPSGDSVQTHSTPELSTFDNGSLTTPAITPDGLQLSANGEQALQKEVEALLDDCATHTTLSPRGCPFGLTDEFVSDSENLYSLRDLTWKIVEYPQTDVAVGHTGLFEISTQTPGKVSVSGTDTSTEKPFSTECEMDLRGSSATVDHGGEVSVSLASVSCRLKL